MTTFLILFGLLCGLVFVYYKRGFKYWKNKNVHGPEPSFPMGNFSGAQFKKGIFQFLREYYSEYKSKGYQYIGLYMFTKPFFMPLDLELIKTILIKDHHHFVDRGVFFSEEEPLSCHLFAIEGKTWRTLRAKLSPTFTSGKMKIMFPILLDVGCQMEKHLVKLVDKNEPLDIKDILARYSTDVIGSCAFGIDCNTFDNPDSEFRKQGNKVFNPTFSQNVKGIVSFTHRNLARKLKLKLMDPELTDFFMNIVRDTISYREENNVDRNDFLKLLIELKNGSSELGTLTLEEIAAQAFVFFVAGFETSSTTMTFCLFELARNIDIQEKVRQEINEVLKRHDGKLTYEAIKEMKYMHAVVDETLRMYPAVPMLNRICTADYRIPGTNTIVEKDVSVMIPTYGLHFDPEIFPNPEKFDPTRFYDDMKNTVPHCSYLPFGEGPRNCIGLRFGLMQTRVGLSVILKNFRISLNNKTKLPLEMNPISFTLSTLQKIYLNAEKIC